MDKNKDIKSSVERTAPWKPAACTLCGIVFGIALHKAHVLDPEVIQGQMMMKQFIMVKFFMSALSASLFSLSLLAMIPVSHDSFMKACNSYYNKLTDKGVMSSVIGGVFMGVGMTVSGSCPVSVFPQMGAMVPNAVYTFLGAVAGTTSFAMFKSKIDSLLQSGIKESSNPWANSPYFITGLPLAAMFGITACAVETLIPWNVEIKLRNPSASFLAQSAWPPYIGGALVGLLQVPMILMLQTTLGGSSSVLVMISQALVGPLKDSSKFLCKYQSGFNHWWQIYYVVGACLGGFFSAWLSGTVGTVAGVSAPAAFIGGFLLYLGARIGGGCTSGHGVSGMGLLSIMSFIFIASTFAGGIISALTFRLAGVL